MCLSIPGKIINLDDQIASIDIAGNIYKAGTHLMEEVKIGDFVLIHSGFIIQKLSPDEAAETENLLRDILNQEKG
jgi:hydrogenase expression/formation protein HypC